MAGYSQLKTTFLKTAVHPLALLYMLHYDATCSKHNHTASFSPRDPALLSA